MTHTPLTISDLILLSQLLDATMRNLPVRWATGGDNEYIAEGIIRHFTNAEGNFLHGDCDVRDEFLRISGTAEHFIPVREVMDLMRDDAFVIGR